MRRRSHIANRDTDRAHRASDVRAALAAIGPATWSELIRHLRPTRGRQSHALRRLVDTLVNGGEVVRSRHGTYRLATGEKVTGEVVREGDGRRKAKVATKGTALCLLADGRSFPLADSRRLRDGDRIEAMLTGEVAEATRVLQPSPEPVVGLLEERAKGWAVESLHPQMRGRIDLLATPSARAGDVVEVRLLAVSERRMEGRVVGVVETGDEASRAAEALLAAYRIPVAWPESLSGLQVADHVTNQEIEGRQDLRDLPLVTIDGADARDFDDAVYAEPQQDGGWRLIVAIADVSHYVKEGSPLDRAARERGNSLYLPDRVVPMLPEALSNGICSLVANEDRLAVACEMQISPQGQLSGFRFRDAVIRSHARLTYDEVDAFLRDDSDRSTLSDGIAASLRALHDVYKALRRQRDERGGLDFDTREAQVMLRGGRPIGVEPRTRNDAHRLIEEAMIAANVAAARFLASAPWPNDRPLPVYRVHESPAAEKLDALELALRIVGERLPPAPVTAQALAPVCQRAREKSSWPGWIWDAIVLRTLPQAVYQCQHRGHFGLALPAYVHFTSPIRRYADLLVHRQIKGERQSEDELAAAAAHISMTERRADEVQRGVEAWLKCALVEERIGETLTGTVAATTPFGLFVELDGLFVQGLLHVSKLGRDYFDYAPETMSLVAQRSGARFALGDRLQVVVDDVSAAAGRIDLALSGSTPRRRRRT